MKSKIEIISNNDEIIRYKELTQYDYSLPEKEYEFASCWFNKDDILFAYKNHNTITCYIRLNDNDYEVFNFMATEELETLLDNIFYERISN